MATLCCVPAAQYAVKATSVLVYPLGLVGLFASKTPLLPNPIIPIPSSPSLAHFPVCPPMKRLSRNLKARICSFTRPVHDLSSMTLPSSHIRHLLVHSICFPPSQI